MSPIRHTSEDPPLELPEVGFILEMKNMSADVSALPGTVPGVRSGGSGFTPQLLDAAEIEEIGTVILEDHNPRSGDNKQIRLSVPSGGIHQGRLLIYFDENGGSSVHVPRKDQTGAIVRSSGDMLRFDVDIRKAEPQPSKGVKVRGVGGIVFQKVLKVIGWKIVDVLVENYVPKLVRAWEVKNRPMQVLGDINKIFHENSGIIPQIPHSKQSLLFIHGTSSRTASCFGGLDNNNAFKMTVSQNYGGHVYAYDHPTLATGVATNVMKLYEQFEPGNYNLDIICHSRGGLVARALREFSPDQLIHLFKSDAVRGHYDDETREWGYHWRKPDGVNLSVGRIVFVATPNNGTILAKPGYIEKYINILLTAANLLPDGIDFGVEALFTIAKALVGNGLPALPGLADNGPDSDIVKELNEKAPTAEDYAIQADFEPEGGLKTIVDDAWDLVLKESNDLVVPTNGVSQWSKNQIPTSRVYNFGKSPNVWHCNIFKQESTPGELLRFLT